MAEINIILATDCGSTTTKAILIEKIDGEYRLSVRGEAPTTVEAPFDDVTVGVLNAVREIEELSGRKIIDDGGLIMRPASGEKTGVDLYLSTSSAGGGLQMTVAGVVKSMSAESAQRAALGAGAIIIDVIAVDDGRKDYEKVRRIRELRPDMILTSGGTDGGTVKHLAEIAEMLLAADPKPRLGLGMKLPVIFAGNKEARKPFMDILKEKVDLKVVDNLRPSLEAENLGPARAAIHELFLQHVMQQAPGYGKLSSWTDSGIMSTPNAVGRIIETIAAQFSMNVLAVDIGGATTDVFSVFDGTFTRTVSANLGMSYSICNVLTEAGIANIQRWVPFDSDETDLRNRLRNKMIRPTTIPHTLDDLRIEQAVSREALRLAFDHHKSLARSLKGVQQVRTIGEIMDQSETGQTLVKMMNLDMIIGSGGVLSHAPRAAETAYMMMDAYQPEGITMLAKDSIFMMPQLGVLSVVHPEAAAQVFERDCLIKFGHVIAPVGNGKAGDAACTITIDGSDQAFKCGTLTVIPLGLGETKEVTIRPGRNFDMGAGKGKPVTAKVEGGTVGLMIDTRGRPMQLPTDKKLRISKLQEWHSSLGLEVGG
ncbi:MAG: glutamate mutase L [Armatimonadetes bacterium]|nr:glutamate mutase L [Armatimonadota bacterium]